MGLARDLLDRLGGRKRVLRSYLERVGPLLVERYGLDASYSPGRVRKTLELAGVSARHLPYAYAMFCSRQDFVECAAAAFDGDATPGKRKCDDDDDDDDASRPAPYRAPERRFRATPDELGPEALAALYDRMRDEVAASLNDGSLEFLPRAPPDDPWVNDRVDGPRRGRFWP